MAALAEPIDYPALARSTTPADRVVLALDRGVPQVAQVTAAVIRALVEAGVDPDGITVLQSPADLDAGAGDPCRLVASPLRERITRLTHDPADRRQLAYLAASESGEAILIHRALHEADVVLPVGCLRAEETAGYFGIHSPIFPAFSDAKTIQRFRGFGSLNGRGSRQRELAAEVDHVAWLLGVNFTIQVVPAAGDRRAARVEPARASRCGGGDGNCIARPGVGPPAPGQPGRGRHRRRCRPTDLGERGPGAAGGRRLCRGGRRDRRLLRPGRRARAGAAAHGARPVARVGLAARRQRQRPSTPCPPPSSPTP